MRAFAKSLWPYEKKHHKEWCKQQDPPVAFKAFKPWDEASLAEVKNVKKLAAIADFVILDAGEERDKKKCKSAAKLRAKILELGRKGNAAPQGVFFTQGADAQAARDRGVKFPRGFYTSGKTKGKEKQKAVAAEQSAVAANAFLDGLPPAAPGRKAPSSNDHAQREQLKRAKGHLQKKADEGDAGAVETKKQMRARVRRARFELKRKGFACAICVRKIMNEAGVFEHTRKIIYRRWKKRLEVYLVRCRSSVPSRRPFVRRNSARRHHQLPGDGPRRLVIA